MFIHNSEEKCTDRIRSNCRLLVVRVSLHDALLLHYSNLYIRFLIMIKLMIKVNNKSDDKMNELK